MNNANTKLLSEFLGKAVKVNGHFFYAADSGSDMPYRNRIDTSESKGNIEIKD